MKFCPDAYLISTPRGGTTSLYYSLLKHPLFEPKRLPKETFHFSWLWQGEDQTFKSARQCFKHRRGTFNVDGSIDYLSTPWAAPRIKRFDPEAKFIAVLRNPVDRAYSNWDLIKKLDPKSEPLTFEEAIEAEAARIPGGAESLTENSPPELLSRYRTFAYLERGKYALHLRKWFEVFPKERFMFIKSKDFFDHPETIYLQVLNFIGAEGWVPSSFERMYCITAANEEDPPPMSDLTRAKLVEYFRPFNEQLYALIGRNLNWEDERTF